MSLSLDTALTLVNAAIRASRNSNVPIAVAVVDTGGRLIAAARDERIGFVNLDVAQRKAIAASNFNAPTQAVLEMLKSDSVALAAVMNEDAICVLSGGFPIVLSGSAVGGLGIAGGHYSQDHTIGEQALRAL